MGSPELLLRAYRLSDGPPPAQTFNDAGQKSAWRRSIVDLL